MFKSARRAPRTPLLCTWNYGRVQTMV